jgi:hypothetical protein
MIFCAFANISRDASPIANGMRRSRALSAHSVVR